MGYVRPHPPPVLSVSARFPRHPQRRQSPSANRLELPVRYRLCCRLSRIAGPGRGIIDAFAGLGSAGAASLRAVAPGIAEALITTAAGLATAIPAVIFYNQFLQNIRDLGQRLDNFAMEVTAQVEKAFD